MEITAIGWGLISLSLGLYLFAPSGLYPATVFSLFFSATAVANIGSGDSVSGVQATMFFGALWLAKEIPDLLNIRRADSRTEMEIPSRRLRLFLLVVVLSLIMPVWINRGVVIESPEFASPDSTALRFTFRHITQTVYVAYGVCLAIFVAVKNSDLREFNRSVRILTISAIFISLWGFLQFSCNLLGLTYPAYIFNTSQAGSALGYTQEYAELGVERVSSVATEPSMFAQCLLIALVFVLFAVVSSRPLISKGWDRFALTVITGALLISTSTTAYIGLVVTGVLCALALLNMRVLRLRHVIAVCLFAAGLGLAYSGYSEVQDLFNSVLIGKGESYSGMARLLSVLMARDYFLQYPLLGLGWGSVTSDDLIFKLLSNTGILGLLAFTLFVISVLTRLWGSVRSCEAENAEFTVLPLSMLVAFVVLLFNNITSGFAYAYSHVWFLFGLAIAVPAVCPPSKVRQRSSAAISSDRTIVA